MTPSIDADPTLIVLFGFAFLLGLRHGIDWDHLVAISDIAGTQESPRRALFLSGLYAVGHSAAVLALGIAAIAAGGFIPAAVDELMGRIVGATLILLGLWVLLSLARDKRNFRMRSRWMLILQLFQRVRSRRALGLVEIAHDHEHPIGEGHGHVHPEAPTTTASAVALKTTTHRHIHSHVLPMPADPLPSVGVGSAVSIGLLHGIGAETPTQVLVLLHAANLGGVFAGMSLLIAFLIGLFVSNMLIAAASAWGFVSASRNFPVYAALAIVTAAVSLALGTGYVLGVASVVAAP